MRRIDSGLVQPREAIPRVRGPSGVVNVHHLELFYYVAQHRGISHAVRHMPYGIQQPAVSTQIGQLERELGVRLFERNPFRLTRAGEELFGFVRPFFSNMENMAARLARSAAPALRVGAAELMLRDYLPRIARRLQEVQPHLQLCLRSGFTSELEAALRAHELDLAIVPFDGRTAPGLHRLRLVQLPLVLLVPRTAKLKSAAELWQRERIETPLICLPEHEVLMRVFRRGLKRMWVEWPCSVEASSLDLISEYVARGEGFGVSVDVPGVASHPKVRRVPLDTFAPVEIAIVWAGKPSLLVQAFVAEAQRLVAQDWPASAGAEPLSRRDDAMISDGAPAAASAAP